MNQHKVDQITLLAQKVKYSAAELFLQSCLFDELLDSVSPESVENLNDLAGEIEGLRRTYLNKVAQRSIKGAEG